MKLIKSSLLILGLLLLIPQDAFASETFLLTPPAKAVTVGESFSVTVSVASSAQAINAVSGVIQIGGSASINSINKQGSIIDFWTTEPVTVGNQVRFEGIVLNPGYQGQGGKLFTLTFSARKEGLITLSFSDGAILANDGLGSNIIDGLAVRSVRINPAPLRVDSIPGKPIATTDQPRKIVALPVITEYPQMLNPKEPLFVRGKGEPGALTKIRFDDNSIKSLGEQFVIALQTKRTALDEVLVQNNEEGVFEYVATGELLAGTYNATPYLVDPDEQTEKPGYGVRFLINESPIVKKLVVLINILILLIPIVGLGVLIYFIPWYSRLRMRLIQKRLHLEEEKISLSETQIHHDVRLVDRE